MLDILFLLMGTVFFGMAVFFFLAMLLAVVLYFYKSNARGGLDLRKKFLELAKSCDSRKYSAIWRSSIPYDSKLKDTISSLEKVDKKDGAGIVKLQVAVQTIKSVALRPWEGPLRSADTWYEPLTLHEDIGKAVAAIAQDLLPFSTGEVINVDGGFHLRRL